MKQKRGSKDKIKGGSAYREIKGGEQSGFLAVAEDILNKYGMVFLAMIFVCIVAIYALLNQNTIEIYIWNYMLALLFPMIMIFAIIINIHGDFESMTLFFKIIASIGLIIGIVYIYTLISGKIEFLTGYVKYLVYAAIGLFGLAILYRSLLNYLSKLQGWPGFLAQLLFYIPCLFYDFLDYLLLQLKITSSTTYVLLAIEVLLISVYFLVPWIINKTTNNDKNGKLLVNDPIFLDKQTEIASSDDLIVPVYMQDLSNPSDHNLYRTNYCISMWVYVDPLPSSHYAYSKETNILTYGHKEADGTEYVKPMIRYYGGGDGKDEMTQRDKYVFYFYKYKDLEGKSVDKEMEYYDISLPNQKWNQIVLNYNRNIVDLFINGNLERSFDMKDRLPRYDPGDKIIVGEENGLRGSICNVMFYHHPLSRYQVATNFNLMVNKRPPVNPYAKSIVNEKQSESALSTGNP